MLIWKYCGVREVSLADLDYILFLLGVDPKTV